MISSDLEFFNRVRNESCQYLHDKTEYTLEDNIKWFDTLEYPFFMVLVDNKRIGYFRTSNWVDGSLYIGMDIAREHRGNKYAVPAYKSMVEILKNNYGIKQILLEVLETNTRAIHIYKKLGFIEIDRFKYSDTEDSIKMELK